ncbi:MAG: DUF2442 domain-containing protein [Nitrospinae bacterium]|nr:DUF2442 domain-containing protein [Nitrospinota bacterium]
MKKNLQIESVEINNGILALTVEGNNVEIELKDVSCLLDKAKPEEQVHFEISPSGYGIHWPLIDEDLSIDGLLGIMHTPVLNQKSA